MKPYVPIVTIVVVAAVAGFALSSNHTKTTGSSASPPTTSTAVSWASAMNWPTASFQRDWGTYNDECPGPSFVCDADVHALNLEAARIADTIDSGEDSSSREYIGPPPATLAKLIEKTRTDAQRVTRDTNNDAHPAATWTSHARKLAGDLDRWEPYLKA